MTTLHLFLSSTERAPSPRWHEAFALGQTVVPSALGYTLNGLQPRQCIVWLSSEDAQWPQMLELVQKTLAGARTVLLSGAPEPEEGLKALDAGVMGYTHSHAVPELLQEVATVVEHGGLWAGPELLRRLVASTAAALARLPEPANGPGIVAQKNAAAWATLSGREAQVARAVAEGKSNKEVADKLFISERTIKAHLGSVFEKLGVRDRLQLVVLVATLGPDTREIKVTAA
jgi:DNA-binding NarL/FixJ family response regulator